MQENDFGRKARFNEGSQGFSGIFKGIYICIGGVQRGRRPKKLGCQKVRV